MKKLLAFFFSPEKERPLRNDDTDDIINDNKDSSLPHAASRLVLYTNLKK